MADAELDIDFDKLPETLSKGLEKLLDLPGSEKSRKFLKPLEDALRAAGLVTEANTAFTLRTGADANPFHGIQVVDCDQQKGEEGRCGSAPAPSRRNLRAEASQAIAWEVHGKRPRATFSHLESDHQPYRQSRQVRRCEL